MENEISTVFDEAIRLMEAAIKKYKDGDIELAEKRRKSANRLFDEARESVESEEGKDDVLYGESRNFGKIYKVFENNTERLFETKEGAKAVSDIFGMIKGDKDLLTEFKIYDAIENPKNVADNKVFTDGLMSLIESFNPSSLKEKHKRLLSKIREYGLDENVKLDAGTERLYECIDYAINNRPEISNIVEMSNAKHTIAEAIVNASKKDAKNVDEVVSSIASMIEEKYDSLLTDEEKQFISELTAPGVDLKGVFENTKRNLQTSLMEAVIKDPKNADSWKELLEKVKNKEYSERTAIGDIAEMVESQNIIG